jgi:hypothetical protein
VSPILRADSASCAGSALLTILTCGNHIPHDESIEIF